MSKTPPDLRPGPRRRCEPWGFFVFLWYGVLWLPRGIASAIFDNAMVLCRLKWRPFTGDARWRWDRPRPDPAANAWQARLSSSPDDLLRAIHAASSTASRGDRARVASVLDRLRAFVEHWEPRDPGRVAELFGRLDPSRLVRPVGQTLLASTRSRALRSVERRDFLARFLDDLRARGTSGATIERLRRRLDVDP